MEKHLTVIYSGLTRLDRANGNVPFSGAPGAMFKHRTLDIIAQNGWTIETRVLGQGHDRPFALGTRILLLGARCLSAVAGLDDNLNKHRGFCLSIPRRNATGLGIPAIATYHPIECWEFSSEDGSGDDDDDEAADKNPSESKDVAATKRGNYFAWALFDFWKLINRADHRLALGWSYDPLSRAEVTPIVSCGQAASLLSALPAGTHITLDIECRPQDFSLDCIGFQLNNNKWFNPNANKPFVVPIYRHTNQLACSNYTELAAFWRALAQTFLRKDITIVGHNLAFDLCVLALCYGLPVPARMYDTMIAMHRDNPFTEKSLSHAISRYLIVARNHKADICPNVSAVNFQRLCQYNAEDVARTAQLRQRQLEFAAARPDLQTSIQQGNKLLHTTLMMSMTGIPTCREAVQKMSAAHRLKADQYQRVCKVLSDNPEFNPGSPDTVRGYFYDKLHYPIEEITKSGQPATGAKALYTLQTKQNNPLFPLVIQYREARKAATSMEFKPLTLKKL